MLHTGEEDRSRSEETLELEEEEPCMSLLARLWEVALKSGRSSSESFADNLPFEREEEVRGDIAVTLSSDSMDDCHAAGKSEFSWPTAGTY